MNRTLVAGVAALIGLWCRLYTLGLPREAARRRLEMLASDVWEQASEARQGGEPGWRTALSLAGRSAFGMHADLAWRFTDARSRSLSLSAGTMVPPEGRKGMSVSRTSPLVLFVVAVSAWGLTAVLAVAGVSHSLAFAAAYLAVLALAGWALELRRDFDGDEATASVWPPLLALGLSLTAAGLVIESSRAGLVVALPLALVASFQLVASLRSRQAAASEAEEGMLPAASIGRRIAQGDVLALERRGQRGISRRAVLRSSVWLGLGTLVAATSAAMVDFLYQRNVSGFGGRVSAGQAAKFTPGSKTRIREGRFWLVHLTQEQGGPGFLALWQRCPHLGCVVPWEEGFNFKDPGTNVERRGWFRCPCHQSTYNDAGVLVYGPAPRSMDRMALSISPDRVIEVLDYVRSLEERVDAETDDFDEEPAELPNTESIVQDIEDFLRGSKEE